MRTRADTLKTTSTAYLGFPRRVLRLDLAGGLPGGCPCAAAAGDRPRVLGVGGHGVRGHAARPLHPLNLRGGR